jgi:CBS domain-containing protein
MQLQNIMTDNVTTVQPNSTVNEAAQIMKNLNIGSVPVCEGSKPVGIITDRDITIRNVAEGENTNIPVNKIMSKNIVSATPDMTVDEATKIMADNQIRRLPIIDNGNILGIVSLGDLAVQSESDMEAGKALSDISVPSHPQS